jgi:hypothetical protein
LLQEVSYLEAKVPNEAAYRLFDRDPARFAIPVVEQGVPIGLLRRHHLLESFAKPFNRELYGKKPCTMMMDKQPLIVNADINVHELSALVVASEQRYLVDGFIITEDGRYGHGNRLCPDAQNDRAADFRCALCQPLTGLPGNVPLSEAIDRLLEAKLPFVVAYADLDNFKPFNDLYGYAAGDEMIQLVDVCCWSVPIRTVILSVMSAAMTLPCCCSLLTGSKSWKHVAGVRSQRRSF